MDYTAIIERAIAYFHPALDGRLHVRGTHALLTYNAVITPDRIDIRALIEQARTDSVRHDGLIDGCLYLIDRRLPLPDELRAFVGGVMVGEIKRPIGKADRRERLPRNCAIIAAVEALRVAGCNPTGNDATLRESGCDLVAKHLHMTYDAVRKVWDRRGDRLYEVALYKAPDFLTDAPAVGNQGRDLFP